jgi:prepilin-type N-terminal cleavage/methylation domain-containing protein
MISILFFLPAERKRGFTLLEILLVLGIIGILSAIAVAAINPSRQFKVARDTQRLTNVEAITSGLSQNVAEHRGALVCGGVTVSLPSVATNMSSVSGDFDVASCLVPDYMSVVPYDPNTPTAHYISATDYNTAYVLYRDTHGRIVASSTGELTPSISAER